MKFFQQDFVAQLCGCSDRPVDIFRSLKVDEHPFALFPAGRFDHQGAVFPEKTVVFVRGPGHPLDRSFQADPLQDAGCHLLVITTAHGHGRGEIAQGLPAVDHPAAMGQGKEAVLGVIDGDDDPPAAGLVDDDFRVGVEVFGDIRTGKQGFVDFVLVLDTEGGDPLEAEFLVEGNGLFVFIENGEIHKIAPPGLKMPGQVIGQGEPDSRVGTLGRDGETPEARAVFRIVESVGMIDAGGGAEDLAGVVIFRDQVGDDATAAVFPDKIRRDRDHAPAAVNMVDRLAIGAGFQASDLVPLVRFVGRAVIAQPQAVGVGRVEKQLLGGEGQQDMGVMDVQGDVALPALLLAQGVGQGFGGLEGMGEDQPPPAAVDFHIDRQFILVRGDRFPPAAGGGGFDPLETVMFLMFFSHAHPPCQMLWDCSQYSSRASCQSFEPRRGVM